MDTSHPTEIAVNRAKAGFSTVIGLALVAMGLNVFLRAPEAAAKIPFLNAPVIYAIGALCVAFFGFATAFSVRRLFRRVPGLILDARGLTDNTSAVPGGFISWADISDVRTGTMGFLYLVLHDPEAFLRGVPPVRRAIMRVNGKIGPSPVVLTASTLGASEAEMAALVRAYLQVHGRG